MGKAEHPGIVFGRLCQEFNVNPAKIVRDYNGNFVDVTEFSLGRKLLSRPDLIDIAAYFSMPEDYFLEIHRKYVESVIAEDSRPEATIRLNREKTDSLKDLIRGKISCATPIKSCKEVSENEENQNHLKNIFSAHLFFNRQAILSTILEINKRVNNPDTHFHPGLVLSLILDKLNLSYRDIADALNIKEPHLSSFLDEKTLLSKKALTDIEELLGLQKDYLNNIQKEYTKTMNKDQNMNKLPLTPFELWKLIVTSKTPIYVEYESKGANGPGIGLLTDVCFLSRDHYNIKVRKCDYDDFKLDTGFRGYNKDMEPVYEEVTFTYYNTSEDIRHDDLIELNPLENKVYRIDRLHNLLEG